MLLELPTVSIIVFAYAEIGYLSATLNSVLEQTYDNYEVLIFCEERDRLTKCLKLNQDCRLKFIFQRNLGIASTFNQGITTAKGEYISLLVAGDLWHPDKLQQQVFCLDRHRDVGLIHSWLLLIDHQSKSTGKIIKHQYSGWSKREFLIDNRIALSSVMIRRSCFEVVGLFDPKLQIVPDWDLWLRLSDRYQFMLIPESLVYCRTYQARIARNFLIVETDLQATIEKAFDRATYPICSPKNRSYSYASLLLAAKIIESKEADPAIAHNYCHQALQHYPLIGLSPEFFRLRLAIIALHCLKSPKGLDRHSRLLRLIQDGNSLFKETIYQLKKYFHKLVHWMLEEEDSIIFWKTRKEKIHDQKFGKQE